MARWKVDDRCQFVSVDGTARSKSGHLCRIVSVEEGFEYVIEFEDGGGKMLAYDDELRPVPALEAMREAVEEG